MKTYFCFFLLILFGLVCTHPIEGKDTKICLTLVVKDDADFIIPCIESVKNMIDCICVCDAGSTDSTLTKIKIFIDSQNIPGKIYPIKDKGNEQNHSASIINAQKALKQWKFPLNKTYLLCIDTKSTATLEKDFDKDSLHADAYLCLFKSPLVCCYYPHLLKASKKWKYEGEIFGQWNCESNEVEKNTSLVINDQRHYNENFLKEQIQLLKNAEKNDQNLFYIGLCYRLLKNYDEAATWLKATIVKEDNQEKIWYSKFLLGCCLEQLDRHEEALQAYKDAYHLFPDRAEPLKALATYHRLRGNNDLAYSYAQQGINLPYPKDAIYIAPEVYHYQFDEELSIAAYYTAHKEEGLNAAHRLILKRNVPNSVKNQTYCNILFYLEPLKNAHYKSIRFALPFIKEDSLKCYNPMNPSIVKTDQGYEVICNVVNYEQTGAVYFPFIEPGIPNQKIVERNYLLNYDNNFNLLSQNEIIENLDRRRCPRGNIQGLEDCRIFAFEKGFWFTCTTSDTSQVFQPQISLCKLANSPQNDGVHVEKLVTLQGPDPFRCEKNWLPFVDKGALRIVYSYDPFIIYRPDVETGECETCLKYTPSHDFSHFRGSAGPIAFDEGHLVIVHEVAFTHYRYYMHRFLYLDKNFAIKKISKPFIFKHLGIEFCNSMTEDHSGNNIVMGVGIEDKEAYLCILDKASIQSLLEPLP